jgi:16S rRNA (guanine1516-N2)-methyltransferase
LTDYGHFIDAGQGVAVLPLSEVYVDQARELALALSLPLLPSSQARDLESGRLLLILGDQGLQLQQSGKKVAGPARVDFDTGALHRRMKSGDGLLAKATGIKPGRDLTILDATAGFGVDAFMMASMGAKLVLCERNPLVAKMLEDGIHRGLHCAHEDVVDAVSRMSLREGSSKDYLLALKEGGSGEVKPSVVYLDPMFPDRKKSALVKKEMQYFHQIVGPDLDADALLPLALAVAEYRVVVKRPRIAPFLSDQEPNLQISGKAHRFDVYTLKTMS